MAAPKFAARLAWRRYASIVVTTFLALMTAFLTTRCGDVGVEEVGRAAGIAALAGVFTAVQKYRKERRVEKRLAVEK